MAQYSTLSNATAKFDDMIKRFGVVTVMNARVYNFKESVYEKKPTVDTAFLSNFTDQLGDGDTGYLCKLDTLKVANVSVEGPDKTVTGGQFSNPLIKFGKTARLEMQDALGDARALAVLGGGVLAWDTNASMNNESANKFAFHMGENFAGPKTIIGDTFFIDQKTGAQVPVTVIFHQVLPDSIFNLTQDAEGDASVFDLNGDLLATTVQVDSTHTAGIFYSIIETPAAE